MSPFFRYFAVRPAMGLVRLDAAVLSHSDNILPQRNGDVNKNFCIFSQKTKNFFDVPAYPFPCPFWPVCTTVWPGLGADIHPVFPPPYISLLYIRKPSPAPNKKAARRPPAWGSAARCMDSVKGRLTQPRRGCPSRTRQPLHGGSAHPRPPAGRYRRAAAYR